MNTNAPRTVSEPQPQPISHLNVLLREKEQLAAALARKDALLREARDAIAWVAGPGGKLVQAIDAELAKAPT